MNQFSLRNLLIGVSIVCAYCALVPAYGIGRAIVCLATLGLAVSSLLFFVAAYHSFSDDDLRSGMAASLLAAMILTGSIFIAAIVF